MPTADDETSTAVDSEAVPGYDSPAMTEQLTPGTELFGYRLGQFIGKGGMGTVYRATQLSLNREVAVKVLHPSRIRNPQQVEGFLREARAAGKLNHPHLVMVHDAHADAERGIYCYAMEYVAGITASRLVQTKGPLPRSTALHLVYQVAKALGHAHRHAMVHRDVKPDNILITSGNVAKLLDLGLVRDRLEHIAQPSSGSRMLTLVGTPDYCSPEQSRNPQNATAASDVYSLGAVLHFLLIGRPPFSGETVIDLIVRVATEPLALPANLAEDCRLLLSILLAKDPDDRYADGDEVAAALELMAKGQPPPPPSRDGQDETETAADEVSSAPGAAPRRRRVLRRRRR
jgi:serine/threonine protein kinase